MLYPDDSQGIPVPPYPESWALTSVPSGAVKDEKDGVAKLDENAWMIKETEFSESTKQPFPSESCSKVNPVVQEGLKLSEEFSEELELSEELFLE